MNNKNNFDCNLMDNFIDMGTVSEKKIKSEIQISYIILSLIPMTIYRIVIYLVMKNTWIKQSNLQFSLLDFNEFCKISSDLSYKILIISIILVISICIMSYISTLNISKYKIKKEYVKNFIKTLRTLQLIISSIIIFFFCIDYVNAISGIPSYISRFEWMEGQTKNKNSNIIFDFHKSENQIKVTYNINLAIEIIFEIMCSIISIKFQEKNFYGCIRE